MMLERIRVREAATSGLLAVDIEALLTWTYRAQRADVVVERGLGLHRIEAAQDRIEIRSSSACGCAAVERIQALGARVAESGGSGALHEDAELVHQAVSRLDRPVQLLVMRHARAGDRPDAMVGVRPKAEPVTNRKGTFVRHDPTDRARRYGWCPVHWSVSVAAILAARLEYSTWRNAIDRVAATLRVEDRLVRHWVTGPAAPATCWQDLLLDS